VKRHPIRPLAAAVLAAALLAPATAAARPAGWTPPPPTGDGTAEVQVGTVVDDPGPQLGTVVENLGAQFGIVQVGNHGLRLTVEGGLPEEPPAPPKNEEAEEDDQSIEDAIRERNRMFGDGLADEQARQEMMRRLMGGMP
jgi:hypothetical protein